MRSLNGFQKGVNLGGWISQFAAYDTEHFDSFITEADIAFIAGLGFDHVRVPVDYNVLEDEEGNYKESGFRYLQNCREWCTRHNLNMLIDLHECYGYSFDLESAQKTLAEAPAGSRVSVSMVATEPEILGDGVYFRDVLGHCETKHTDDENRNTNLRLLCQALDGVILQPGDVFSFNDTVGERTEEKGYKPATAYSGTKMIKDIGGGVCQGSTTIYNCALLADLEIVERVCHGATVGYITLGLDAAVNWNTKTDLKFKNNFNFPMMIKAEVSDGYVRMRILGTDEKDYYIEMRCGFGEEGDVKHAVSYKFKFDKETGEQISKEREAFSTYYKLG